MMKDSTYHSRSPHDMKLKIEPVRLIWPRSTANTPIWQVTLDATSTRVFAVASGRSRSAIGQAKPWPLSTERIVKYIANSAAKNISSLDSQIMVPTLTRFGLLAGLRGTGVVSVTDPVVTRSLLRHPVGDLHPTPRVCLQIATRTSPSLPLVTCPPAATHAGTSPLPPVTCPPAATPCRDQPLPPAHSRPQRPAPRGPVGCRAMKVVVYSHDADTRAEMKLAIGRRPAPDVPEAEIVEVATAPALFRLLDAGGADVMVLDGEAQPAGGMGVSRQAKDEIYNCPPVLLIIARADDRWLATWSRADSVISHPIDPVALARELAALMRSRAAAIAAQ